MMFLCLCSWHSPVSMKSKKIKGSKLTHVQLLLLLPKPWRKPPTKDCSKLVQLLLLPSPGFPVTFAMLLILAGTPQNQTETLSHVAKASAYALPPASDRPQPIQKSGSPSSGLIEGSDTPSRQRRSIRSNICTDADTEAEVAHPGSSVWKPCSVRNWPATDCPLSAERL